MSRSGRSHALRLAAVAALLILTACTAPTPTPAPPPQAPGAAAPPSQTASSGRIVIVTRDEPVTLDSRLYRTHEVQDLVNAPIAYHDETDVVRPLLVERLPSRDDGSWTIQDNGSMI